MKTFRVSSVIVYTYFSTHSPVSASKYLPATLTKLQIKASNLSSSTLSVLRSFWARILRTHISSHFTVVCAENPWKSRGASRTLVN